MSTDLGNYIETKVGNWMQQHPEEVKSINANVLVELKGEGGGTWLLDFFSNPPSIKKDENASAETKISMEASIFQQIIDGELTPEAAFLSGQVTVDGDLGLSIKLGEMLMSA